MSLKGFEWNQAELGEYSQMNNGMIVILAFEKNRSPRLIGTAFIISIHDSGAIAVTAAHNFEGVKTAQSPNSTHHPTALPEFLGEVQKINLDRKEVRAICYDLDGVEVAPILWAAWDVKTDVAFFSIAPQDAGPDFFKSCFNITNPPLSIGDEVALLGYADMEVKTSEVNEGGFHRFKMHQRPLLRLGKITQLHNDGHILCRGPCIETSIPVFSGMSGGPVFKMGEEGEFIKPFGIISSDPEAEYEQKNDRSIKGSTIVSLLKVDVKSIINGVQKISIKLDDANFLHSKGT